MRRLRGEAAALPLGREARAGADRRGRPHDAVVFVKIFIIRHRVRGDRDFGAV